MDIALCLDFFAVCTYITDYYTKTETKMMSTLQAAAKTCKDKDRMTQLRYMAKTFLTHRETGESEIIYRIMPHLHLAESNVKCVFVATGFPHNRSRMARKVKGKDSGYSEENENDEENMPHNRYVEIPGKEGKYVENISWHEKYAARPPGLKEMCLAQFATAFDTMPKKSGSDYEFENGVFGKSEFPKNKMLVSWNPQYEKVLPTHIELKHKLGYMRLRERPAVLRIHKFREDKNPHEYLYSKLVLYCPWETEDELFEHDYEACQKKFKYPGAEKSHIEIMEENLFPHANAVNESRAVLENFADTRPSHIADALDPEDEKDKEEGEMEGLMEDEDYAARIPEEQMNDQEGGQSTSKMQTSFRQVDIPRTESELLEMFKSVRSLDLDQRVFLDIMVEFVKRRRTSCNSTMQSPIPPLLKVQGGAGAGKSTVINAINKVCKVCKVLDELWKQRSF